MESTSKSSSAPLFQVYLRLRPPPSPLVQLTPQSLYPLLPPPERYLTVEEPASESDHGLPTHITIHPPTDSRKRAVEKFAFTKVFEEEAVQLDIFKGAAVESLVEGILRDSKDGLLATLGVTGSGKVETNWDCFRQVNSWLIFLQTHTILGSKSQRGLTQLSLDLIYRSLSTQLLEPTTNTSLVSSLSAADASEAQIISAQLFLEGVYGDSHLERNTPRAQTPMTVCRASPISYKTVYAVGGKSQWPFLDLRSKFSSQDMISKTFVNAKTNFIPGRTISTKPYKLAKYMPFTSERISRRKAKDRFGDLLQDPAFAANTPKSYIIQRSSALPQHPDISNIFVSTDTNAEYAILVSMYEVYNDRIFDLLSNPRNLKDFRRRALLFKPTEASPDRKVVAGLRKVVCGSYEEALMVLETGLMERRVAGTGSNSVSSRSHGSERARNAKTAGATLAEAGKINESLMYLGQCLQMQSDCQDGTKPTLVPFRQCKLTELLFSNSFASSYSSSHHNQSHHRNPQKAVMIVTADPLGDFNATSQILRYSALAREVTVPRIPSVSSTILAGAINGPNSHKQATSGRTSPNSTHTDEAVVEMAFSEIARLSEEVEILGVKLAEQEGRRKECEEGWQRAHAKAEEIERESERNDEHLDRKLEIFTRGIQTLKNPALLLVYEDPIEPSSEQRVLDLEAENAALRRQMENLERDMQSRSSPTRVSKKQGLISTPRKGLSGSSDDDLGTTLFRLNAMRLSPKAVTPGAGVGAGMGASPAKKMRKLTARKWDLMDENELAAYD
ncbi:MAG: hypothetical protein Q9167_005393 [Letrouitia subvulpina]